MYLFSNELWFIQGCLHWKQITFYHKWERKKKRKKKSNAVLINLISSSSFCSNSVKHSDMYIFNQLLILIEKCTNTTFKRGLHNKFQLVSLITFLFPKEQQKIAGRNLREPCPRAIKNGLNLLLYPHWFKSFYFFSEASSLPWKFYSGIVLFLQWKC